MSSGVAETTTLKPRSALVRMGLVAILAATCLCYMGTLQFAFVYDDVPQIVKNPRIQSVHFLPEYFVKHVWAQDPGQPQNLYRPLFLAWLLANFKSFGLQARYWHVTASVLHLLMVFLVYFLARRLLAGKPLGVLVAVALFAAHPSHVEAVAWISGATEPLFGIFFVGSLLCYLKGRDQQQVRIYWTTASLLLAACAVLTKETAVVLPAVILCYEWFLGSDRVDPAEVRQRSRLLKLACVLAPYAVLLGAYFALRFTALHGVAHSISDVPVWKSILSLPWLIYFYLSQLLVPTGFGPYYDADYASGFNVVVPILVLAGIAAGIWWWCKKAKTRLPFFLASWFLLTLAPALALFIVIWHYDNVHDRYLYLPSVAAAILVGHVIATVAEKLAAPRKIWVWGASFAVLALLFVASYRQAFYWKDNLALYTRGIKVAPHNIVAKLNLAGTLFENQYYDDALSVSRQALQIDPNSRVALTDVAQALYFRGDYAGSENYYARALALGPPSVDQVYYLSLAKIKMGRYAEALFLLQKGISYWPDAPGYHAAMGQALAGLGDWATARSQYQLELKQNPSNFRLQRKIEEAEAHLESSHQVVGASGHRKEQPDISMR
jgi:tetratricopeptide (TPR) repeat protein